MPAVSRPSGRSGRPSVERFVPLTVVTLIVIVIALIVGVTVVAGGFDKTQGGEVAVVRNGGPLDNHRSGR